MHARSLCRRSRPVVATPAPFAAVRTCGYGGDWREGVRRGWLVVVSRGSGSLDQKMHARTLCRRSHWWLRGRLA